MNRTDYWANKLIDFEFRDAALSKPTEWHWALFTTAPSKAGGGVEVTGGSYARVACAPDDANWFSTQGTLSANSSGTTQRTSNGITLTFPSPTANWGKINGMGIFDAATSGNLCYWLDFEVAKILPFFVLAGEGALYFAPGSAVINFAS